MRVNGLRARQQQPLPDRIREVVVADGRLISRRGQRERLDRLHAGEEQTQFYSLRNGEKVVVIVLVACLDHLGSAERAVENEVLGGVLVVAVVDQVRSTEVPVAGFADNNAT